MLLPVLFALALAICYPIIFGFIFWIDGRTR